jgi:signal transduction histidine kinase/ActR/RegA family two-component response regulator
MYVFLEGHSSAGKPLLPSKRENTRGEQEMWAWRKKQQEDSNSCRGAAHAGLAGASREALMREALHSLSRDGRADRIGVWLEQDPPSGPEGPAAMCLRGMIWEAEGEDTPEEWKKLSLESPLPQELLVSSKSVEQELDVSQDRPSNQPMIGPLVGLRHALWTPVAGRGHVRGVLLTGTRRKQTAMPRDLAQSVAAELALALEFEQEQRLARERHADVRLSKEILGALAGTETSDAILLRLVASCAEESADKSGAGASFAILGHCPATAPMSPARAEMEFAWESGDPAWTRAVHREPLASLWRAALEAGQVQGAEPPASWSKAGLARLVAIPLLSAGEALGVLVAGISQKTASLTTLERLELRASLAVSALERRRQRAEQLRRIARRHALLEFSPEPTVLLDAQGNIASLNRTAKVLLEEPRVERTPESLREQDAQVARIDPAWAIGGRFASLFCAREQSRIEEWSSRAFAGERDKAIEVQEVCEGELVNGVRVRLHAPVFAGEDLAAVVFSPAAGDDAAQQRSRSEAELQNVLEWVEEGILLFGANHSIRAMNMRFAQIAGLSLEEAASCTTLDALINRLAERAADPESFARRWRELARGTEGGSREELQLARPVPRVLERSVRPVLDKAGRRLGRVEIYRDLTAQRVFQAKLLQTEKLAALGQMVTGIAHELSNPLTSILGYSQRLLVRKDLAGRTEEARQIYEEAERAGTILRQLLLSAREARPERNRVALNQVIMRAMELQRFGSAAEKIRIELDLDPTLPFVTGDAGQLQQVLMNLIGNARQAIVQAGRAGTIRLRTARDGERRMILQVSDDGPGIPQAILARIFDPFFTTKPAGVGTGLGLAIVLSVVREHGGQVSVSSPPDGGSVFSVELPVEAESSLEPGRRFLDEDEQVLPVSPGTAGRKNRPRSLPQALPRSAPRSNHRGTRVLVVEDEPTVARLIADVLEDEGLHVDVLLDGREALDRAGREPFDLVICDMKMPGLDGQNFYQSLARARNPLQERFLFVTGDVIAQQTQEFLERNRLPHVAKPFRVEELTEKVFSLLDNQLARGGRTAAAKKAH